MVINMDKNKKGILLYIAMFWLMYVADSMLFSLNNNSTLMRYAQLSQLVVGFVLVFFMLKKKISVNFAVLLVISASILVTGILVDNSMFVSFRKISALIIGYYVAKYVDTKKMIDIYCEIMMFIAVISLLAYSIPNVITSISFLPRIVTSTREAEFHSLLFTNIPTVSWSQARNWGPFWEPGAYQAFLNVALIFTLFIREKKGKHWILSSIVFTVAVISTLSTTGYLALFFIYLAYTFSNNKEKGFTNTFGKIALICLALIGAIYVVFYSDLFESVVTTKLQNEDTSRYQFVIYGMKAFAESPLIGNGASLSSVIHSFAGSDISRTNTFVAMFAIFGVLPGVYTIVCYVKMFADFRKLTTILSTMFIGVAFCCMLFGEYFIYSPIWAWLMYLVPSEYVNRSTQNLIV